MATIQPGLHQYKIGVGAILLAEFLSSGRQISWSYNVKFQCKVWYKIGAKLEQIKVCTQKNANLNIIKKTYFFLCVRCCCLFAFYFFFFQESLIFNAKHRNMKNDFLNFHLEMNWQVMPRLFLYPLISTYLRGSFLRVSSRCYGLFESSSDVYTAPEYQREYDRDRYIEMSRSKKYYFSANKVNRRIRHNDR